MQRSKWRKLVKLNGKVPIKATVTRKEQHLIIAREERKLTNRQNRINWKKNMEETKQRLQNRKLNA